eukprot:6490943-Amphidinium_carterae.4
MLVHVVQLEARRTVVGAKTPSLSSEPLGTSRWLHLPLLSLGSVRCETPPYLISPPATSLSFRAKLSQLNEAFPELKNEALYRSSPLFPPAGHGE